MRSASWHLSELQSLFICKVSLTHSHTHTHKQTVTLNSISAWLLLTLLRFLKFFPCMTFCTWYPIFWNFSCCHIGQCSVLFVVWPIIYSFVSNYNGCIIWLWSLCKCRHHPLFKLATVENVSLSFCADDIVWTFHWEGLDCWFFDCRATCSYFRRRFSGVGWSCFPPSGHWLGSRRNKIKEICGHKYWCRIELLLETLVWNGIKNWGRFHEIYKRRMIHVNYEVDSIMALDWSVY